jgi:hypothetical protein
MIDTCDKVIPPAAKIPSNKFLELPFSKEVVSIVVPGNVVDTLITSLSLI